jgi:hypothetical protein
MIWLLPHPFPLSRHEARPSTRRKTEKERQHADGRGGGGGVRREANSYDSEKACSSINHSILSEVTSLYSVKAKGSKLRWICKRSYSICGCILISVLMELLCCVSGHYPSILNPPTAPLKPDPHRNNYLLNSDRSLFFSLISFF